MAVFNMPTSFGPDVFPNYRFAVELDGVEFRFGFKFNSRQQTWFFNLSDANGVLLRAGVPVVTGIPLLLRMAELAAPDGSLIAVSLAGDIVAGLEQLGQEVILTYVGES